MPFTPWPFGVSLSCAICDRIQYITTAAIKMKSAFVSNIQLPALARYPKGCFWFFFHKKNEVRIRLKFGILISCHVDIDLPKPQFLLFYVFGWLIDSFQIIGSLNYPLNLPLQLQIRLVLRKLLELHHNSNQHSLNVVSGWEVVRQVT